MTPRTPAREGWRAIYAGAPAVFDAFARAEDPEGLIARTLVDEAGLAGTRVLEIGAGTGRLAERLAPCCASVTVTEPVPAMMHLAHERLRGVPRTVVLGARAEALPFASRSFDTVVAAWVVAYLRPAARERALSEAHRVVDPAGTGVVLVESAPVSEFQELRRASGADPAREFAVLGGLGFATIATIETEIAFDDEAQARGVIGALCGDGAAAALDASPRRRIGHAVAILRAPR